MVVVGCCCFIEIQSPQSVLTQVVSKAFKSELYCFPGVDSLWVVVGLFWVGVLFCLHTGRMSFCQNFFLALNWKINTNWLMWDM